MGNISSIRSVAIAVQELLPPWSAVDTYSAEIAALAKMQQDLKQDFERELLFAEVPEVECACFNVTDMQCRAVPVQLELELDIAVRGGAQHRQHIPSRWMWAEVVGVDVEGAESYLTPRITLHRANREHFDPSVASKFAEKDLISFQRSLKYSPQEGTS